MASSLQALSNRTTNHKRGGTKEEEDKLEREENNLTATGNTGGTLALTAMGTNGSGDANGSGLRRLTRATLKTPAEPDSSKGETVLTLDPTTTQQPKKAGKKRKAPTDSSELRELLGATHVLGGKGTARPRAPRLNVIQNTAAPTTQLGPASTSSQLTINGTPLNTNIASSIATPDLPLAQTTELNSQLTQTTATSQSIPATQDSLTSTTPDSQMSAPQKRITCTWTDADDQKMINTLKDEKLNNAGTFNGFKTTSWAVVALALKGTEKVGTKAKDPGTCKSRWGALKRTFASYKSVNSMSGAGWDESAKMVTLPASVWMELKKNNSKTGRALSRWETQAFPLYHDLMFLIGPDTANGDLMETTANDEEETQRDIGDDVLTDLAIDLRELEEDDVEDDDDLAVVPVKSTPTPAKRKRGSVLSPDLILSELKSMSSSLAESMKAPIPPLVFAPSAAPPSVNEEGLTDNQLFDAIDFLGIDTNAEVYISLSDAIRPTWLMKKLEGNNPTQPSRVGSDTEIATPMTTHLANDPVDADNAVTNGPEERERKNLASPLEMALNATQNGKEGELDRFFSVLAAFNTKPTPSNLVQEVTQSIPSSTGTSLQVGATGCFRITSTTKK
ncbi:hypothetical protein PSHT_01835, partial [Puccinia striiformis]